jgi:hypothetical protein
MKAQRLPPSSFEPRGGKRFSPSPSFFIGPGFEKDSFECVFFASVSSRSRRMRASFSLYI